MGAVDIPFDSISEGLLVIVILILLVRGKRMVNYAFDAVGDKIVKSINGGLGLDGIRKDIEAMKGQMEDVADLRIQIENLEGQIEPLITDE